MPRKILTPEERELRRKERNKKAANDYKTHTGERGSPESWREIFKARLTANVENDLMVFGIDKLPANKEDLKKLYRDLMKTVHPDVGGQNDIAAIINQAYENLLKKYISN